MLDSGTVGGVGTTGFSRVKHRIKMIPSKTTPPPMMRVLSVVLFIIAIFFLWVLLSLVLAAKAKLYRFFDFVEIYVLTDRKKYDIMKKHEK